jgi:hypothetical protein
VLKVLRPGIAEIRDQSPSPCERNVEKFVPGIGGASHVFLAEKFVVFFDEILTIPAGEWGFSMRLIQLSKTLSVFAGTSGARAIIYITDFGEVIHGGTSLATFPFALVAHENLPVLDLNVIQREQGMATMRSHVYRGMLGVMYLLERLRHTVFGASC